MRNVLWIFCICILIAQDPFNWQEDGAPIRQGAHIEWWKSVESGNSNDALDVMKMVYRIYYADEIWREKFNIKNPD